LQYTLTDNSRVEFIARAPLHSVKGRATTGLAGTAVFDLDQQEVHHIRVTAATGTFQTDDPEKTRAMAKFFTFAEHPETSFIMTGCREFLLLASGNHRITVQGILTFAGIRRQLPITSIIRRSGQNVMWDLQFKWSFTAYGLQPPSLLFMKLRDIVDVRACLEFKPVLPEVQQPCLL